MGMGQGVRTGLGHGASPVSYRHSFLVFYLSENMENGKISGKNQGKVREF